MANFRWFKRAGREKRQLLNGLELGAGRGATFGWVTRAPKGDLQLREG